MRCLLAVIFNLFVREVTCHHKPLSSLVCDCFLLLKGKVDSFVSVRVIWTVRKIHQKCLIYRILFITFENYCQNSMQRT